MLNIPSNKKHQYLEELLPNVPQDLEWEYMQEGILLKMRAYEAKKSRKRRLNILRLLLFVALLVVLLIPYNYSPTSFKIGGQKFNSDRNYIPSKSLEKTPIFLQVKQSNRQIESYESIINVPVGIGQKSKLLQFNNLKYLGRKQYSLIKYTTNSNLSPVKVPINLMFEYIKNDSNNQKKQFNDIGLKDDNSSVESARRDSTFQYSESLSDTPSQEVGLEGIDSQKHQISQAKSELKSIARYKYGIESGVFAWTGGAMSSQWADKSYSSSQMSFQLQCYLQKQVSRSTFILTGLQYQQFNSKLDYRNTLTNYNLILSDTVVRVIRNLVTGQMEYVYGDVNELTTAERIVIHYNSSNMFRVFFGVGHNLQLSKLEAEVYYGTTINVLSNHSGRTVSGEDVIDYNRSQNSVFYTGYNLDVLAGGRLKLPVNSSLSFSSGIQFQQSLMNWSLLQDRSLSPFSVGINFGVQLRPKIKGGR